MRITFSSGFTFNWFNEIVLFSTGLFSEVVKGVFSVVFSKSSKSKDSGFETSSSFSIEVLRITQLFLFAS